MIKTWIKRIEEFKDAGSYVDNEDIQEAMLKEISELREENQNLLKANLDCILHFNSLMEDYDLLIQETKTLI